MTGNDGEREERETRSQPSEDPPSARPDPTEVTGTWAYVSPFATSPESFGSVAGPNQDRPASEPTERTARHSAPEPDGQQAGWVGPAAWVPPPQQPTGPGAPGGPPSPPPTWGAPAAAPPGGKPPSRWKPWQKVAAGGALATVVAIGGVAAVTAANASAGDTATTQAGFAGEPGAGGYPDSGRSGTLRGGLAGASALANALHGDFVVASGDGTQTMRLQTGEITDLSSDSLTVKSTDGYTSTYAIGTGVDVSGLATGDTVRVIATVSGDTATATSVQSGSASAGGAGQGGPQPPDGMNPPNGGGQAPQTS